MSRNRYRILSHNLSRSQHRVSRNGDRSLFHNRSRHQHWLPKANNANRSARNVKPSAPSPGKFLIQTNHQRRSPRKSVSLNLVQGHQIPRNEKPQQVPRSGKNEPVHGNKTNHSIMGLHINFSRKSILSLFCGMHGWCSSGLQAILLLRSVQHSPHNNNNTKWTLYQTTLSRLQQSPKWKTQSRETQG